MRHRDTLRLSTGGINMRVAVIAFLGFLLAGCAGVPGGNFVGGNTEQDRGALPPNYKAQVEQTLKSTLKDPYSAVINVGDAIASTCQIGIYGPFYGWAVPVTYNAKNSFGAFTGETSAYFWFANGQIKRVSGSLQYCP